MATKKPSPGSPSWRPGSSDKEMFDNLLKDIVTDPGQRSTLGARLQELQVLARAPQLKTEIRDLAVALEKQYKELQANVSTLIGDSNDAQDTYEEQRRVLEGKTAALEDVVKEALPTAVAKVTKEVGREAKEFAKAQKVAQREQKAEDRARAVEDKRQLNEALEKNKAALLEVMARHIQDIKDNARDDDLNQIKLQSWLEKNFKDLDSGRTSLLVKLQQTVQRHRETGVDQTLSEALEEMIQHFGQGATVLDKRARQRARSLAKETISKAKSSSKGSRKGYLSGMLASKKPPKGKPGRFDSFDPDFESINYANFDDPFEEGGGFKKRFHSGKKHHGWDDDYGGFKERGLLRKSVDKLWGLVKAIPYRARSISITGILATMFVGAGVMLAKPIGFAVGFLWGYVKEKFSRMGDLVNSVSDNLKSGITWVGNKLMALGDTIGKGWTSFKDWFRSALNSFFHRLPAWMRPSDSVDEGALLEGPSTPQAAGTYSNGAQPMFTKHQAMKDLAGIPKALDTINNPANYTTSPVPMGSRFGALGNVSTVPMEGSLQDRVGNDFSKAKSFWGDLFRKKDGNVDTDNLAPEVHSRFNAMLAEYRARGGKRDIQVNSAYRSTEEQSRLYAKDPGRAALPGTSVHEIGRAIDIQSADANELDRMGLLDKYGFSRPVPNEPWHIQQAGIAKMLTNGGWNNADYPTTTNLSLTGGSEASNFIKQPSMIAPAPMPLRPGNPVPSSPVQQLTPGPGASRTGGSVGAPFRGTTETIPTFSYSDPRLLMANVGILSGR